MTLVFSPPWAGSDSVDTVMNPPLAEWTSSDDRTPWSPPDTDQETLVGGTLTELTHCAVRLWSWSTLSTVSSLRYSGGSEDGDGHIKNYWWLFTYNELPPPADHEQRRVDDDCDNEEWCVDDDLRWWHWSLTWSLYHGHPWCPQSPLCSVSPHHSAPGPGQSLSSRPGHQCSGQCWSHMRTLLWCWCSPCLDLRLRHWWGLRHRLEQCHCTQHHHRPGCWSPPVQCCRSNDRWPQLHCPWSHNSGGLCHWYQEENNQSLQ